MGLAAVQLAFLAIVVLASTVAAQAASVGTQLSNVPDPDAAPSSTDGRGPLLCVEQVGVLFSSDDDLRRAEAVLRSFPGVLRLEAYTTDDLGRWIHTTAAEGRGFSELRATMWIVPVGDAEALGRSLEDQRAGWTRGLQDSDPVIMVADPCDV